ncbi:MAG: Ig-like domain-containing protein [Candidatus Methanoperedens sp.]|nr:Ig-like domain-containing protein [Candidatus Methanoperedens sp.]
MYKVSLKKEDVSAKRIFSVISIALILFIFMNPLATAASIQKFNINSKYYAANDPISVSGAILDGNASGAVNITIWVRGNEFNGSATSSQLIYASSGAFSTTIYAPGTSEDYTVAATYVESGVNSQYLNMTVLGLNDPGTIKTFFSQGSVLVVPLSSSHGITGPLNASKTGGSVTFDGRIFYFLVSNDDVAYMDDDSDMNLSSDSNGNSVVGNLVEGSKVKLNATTYTIMDIHNDTQIVLARPIAPVFAGNEVRNVTFLVLNSTNYPLSQDIFMEYIMNDGTAVSNATLSTNSNGTNTTSITIEDASGIYHLIAGNIGHLSFMVNTNTIFSDILSEENKPKHTFSRGELLKGALYLKDVSTGYPVITATVTATIRSQTNNSFILSKSLVYDSNISAYTYSYEIPPTEEETTYNVEFTSVNNSQTQKAFTSYNIKSYNLFLKPVSKERKDSDGFAPGMGAFMILAGTNLSGGENINIEDMIAINTGNFRVNITSSTGTDVTPSWNVMNQTTFFSYLGVPLDIQSEIKMMLGNNFTIINFTAPSANGMYNVVVQANISGWVKASTTISVQDMFVHGEPVNKNGWFNPKVSPGGFVRLNILAFNPFTGERLNAANISEAGLVEVWSEGANDIVTEDMLNVTLEDIQVQYGPGMSETIKVLKFTANDSHLGFHNVKFWVNATIDGSPKKVIGDGWFDEKSYEIFVKPQSDSGSGMFKTFGSGDNISLSVKVKDVSGNNVSSATIEVSSLKYGMTGENIPYGVDSSQSTTTDSNGEATLTILNTNRNLKSGFYTVRVKMTTQEGVIDYGNGWFEVSNFIFFAYSTSFDNGIGRPINFTLNAFNSSFFSKNVSVTLTTIISMGDFGMMAPPTVYNETDVEVGYINGTGFYEYSAGINKGGNFEFVFEARDGNSTEVGRAWVNLRSFVTWVDTNNVYEFSTTGFMNATVVASRDNNMGGSSGSSINITNVTVEKVMQEGMYMTSYRSKSEMAAITTTEKVNGVDNRINISVNTSGWGQGGYIMKLKVTDNQSNEVYTDFWFRMALAGVYMPELNMVNVNGGTYYTNKTSFNASTDVTSVKSKFADQSLGNVTAGKVSGRIVNDNSNDAVRILQSSNENQIFQEWNPNENPQFAMVVVDTVMRTLYIEYRNFTIDGNNIIDRTQYYNLSNSVTTQVFNASIGDTFTDNTGRTWRITSITDDGTVNIEGINALKNGIILNSTILSRSISGKFLFGQMWDDEWRDIDLDGDNEYFNDRYYILMIDGANPGVYDTVYVSNSTNFSLGYKDASAGDAVGFGGKPTYLISNKYQSGTYQLQFTTYRQGWGGMNLGTFANGTVVKIPFLVSNPGGSAISGSNVSIDFLMDESREQTPLSGVNATTDANGLAIILINTTLTSIPTGSWTIIYNATIGTSNAVADDEMFWQLPRFELRNFVVSGALGIPGRIDLIKLNDSDTSDGIPGNNMLISYGDEIDFQRGIGFWWNDGQRYQLEYPFNDWYYNSTSNSFNYSPDHGFTMSQGDGNLINSSSAKSVITYNVTIKQNIGTLIDLHIGVNNFSEFGRMWRFNVTEITGSNATILMSYRGWPWTWPDPQQPWNQPQSREFIINDNWWIGGLDFRVIDINLTNQNVQLRLNQPVLIARIDALSILTDGNDANGEAKKMRGSVNSVNFSGNDYLIYGYEDNATTSGDLVNGFGRIETMDRVLVVNQTNGGSNVYRIGQLIPEFNNYYVAGAPEWGGMIFLLNGSVTRVFPIPQWTADSPIFYTGRFSDQDIGQDVPTMDVNNPEAPRGTITSDLNYSILMFDRLANGVNFPTEAIYDDDSDLTQLNSWSGSDEVIYDMYNNESGNGDAIAQQMGDPGPMVIRYINMSEKFAWDIGTGNMQTWPIAIPTVNVSDSSVTGTAKTFARKDNLNRSDNITIYVIAKDFSGVNINGVANLTQIKMSFGGNITNGFFETLPMTFTMTTPINVTLVDGEGLITLTPAQLPAELRSGGSYDFDFAELTAIVQITDVGTGRVETLKNNFFVMAKDKMSLGGPMEGGKTSGGGGGGSGGGGGGGGTI